MLLSKKNNILNVGYKNKRFIEKGLGAFVYIKKKNISIYLIVQEH